MFSLIANNFYEVAKPLHISSQLLGLTSFTIKKSNGVFSSTMTLYNLATVLIVSAWNIYVSFIVITQRSGWSVNRLYLSSIFENFANLILFWFISTTSFINLWTVFKRRRFSVDDELTEMNVSINFRQHKKNLLKFIFCITTFLVCSMVLSVIISELKDIHRASFLLTITMCQNIATHVNFIFQFIFLMAAVKSRYQKINLVLQQILTKKIYSRSESNTLSECALVHDQLGDVIDSINKCFGVPVSSIHLTRINFE